MQISERLADVHPEKIVSALNSFVKDGHQQSALQAIPDLQLQHPQLSVELELVKQQLSDKLLDGVKVVNSESAQVFRCANCGAGLARQNPDTVHVICQYCGCDAEHPAENQALSRWNRSLDLESRFTIGDMFELDGTRWQAVGVQLYIGTVREWDSEDDIWEKTRSQYTNWWMLNENRELAWLVDDGKSRYWAEKFTPSDPKLPNSDDRSCEHGEWQLEFAAGEFSYQPNVHEKYLSAEYASRQSKYLISVESQLDENGEVREVEFIRSRQLADKQILRALARAAELQDVNRWQRTARAFLFAIPLIIVAFMYLNRGGTETQDLVSLSTDSADVLVAEVAVENAGEVLKFHSSVNGVASNSWFGVNLVFENSDDLDVYHKYIEFWHESGYDSDGSWSERDLASSWFVRFDEPGNFRVLASVEPRATTKAVKFSLATERNRVSMIPFALAAGFALFLNIMSKGKKSSIATGAASLALKLRNRARPARDQNKVAKQAATR